MKDKIDEITYNLELGCIDWQEASKQLFDLYGVSNRLEPICAKAEPLIIEINKDHLVELYDFAYEQAVKTDKVNELKDIDAKLNGC